MSDPIQIGDFRIERQIGAGGMGIVYLATQLSPNRQVAPTGLGPVLTRQSDIARFQREAQAAAFLESTDWKETFQRGGKPFDLFQVVVGLHRNTQQWWRRRQGG